MNSKEIDAIEKLIAFSACNLVGEQCDKCPLSMKGPSECEEALQEDSVKEAMALLRKSVDRFHEIVTESPKYTANA